jgi:hypothetical protein
MNTKTKSPGRAGPAGNRGRRIVHPQHRIGATETGDSVRRIPVSSHQPRQGAEFGPRTKTPIKERNVAMTDKTRNPGSAMFDQALENYEQALRNGLKLQEEAAKCWSKLLNQAASPQDLPKQVTAMANEVIPATQKHLEACLELLRQNSHTSVDLLKQGIEAAQTTSLVEGQGKLVDFCESSLKSLKANAQAIVDLNSKAVDSWVGLMKKATGDVVERKAETA